MCAVCAIHGTVDDAVLLLVLQDTASCPVVRAHPEFFLAVGGGWELYNLCLILRRML